MTGNRQVKSVTSSRFAIFVILLFTSALYYDESNGRNSVIGQIAAMLAGIYSAVGMVETIYQENKRN